MKIRVAPVPPGPAAAPAPAPAPAEHLTLFELRSYVARPGARDALIEMFETHFLDAYERAGARIWATFRNLDTPDQWVWGRAFRDNAARAPALAGFYDSPAWKARRKSANDLIAKSADAILTRALCGNLEFQTAARAPGMIECLRVLGRGRQGDALKDLILRHAAPEAAKLGAHPVAILATARVENTFPRQRLRASPAIVLVSRFDNAETHAAHLAARRASQNWRAIEDHLAGDLKASTQCWRLHPTPRSPLR